MKKQDIQQGYCIILNSATFCLSVESYVTARHITDAQYIKHIDTDDISMQQKELEKVKDSFKTYRAFENAYKNFNKEIEEGASNAEIKIAEKTLIQAEAVWLDEFESTRKEKAWYLVFKQVDGWRDYTFDILELDAESFVGFSVRVDGDYYIICKKLDAKTYDDAIIEYNTMLDDCDYHNFRKQLEHLNETESSGKVDNQARLEAYESSRLVYWQYLQYLHAAGWRI